VILFLIASARTILSATAHAQLTFLPWSSILYLTATYTYHFPPTWAPYSTMFHPTAVPLAWIVFTAAWIGQFIGHGVFEKRAPALKDNLVQGEVSLRVAKDRLGGRSKKH